MSTATAPRGRGPRAARFPELAAAVVLSFFTRDARAGGDLPPVAPPREDSVSLSGVKTPDYFRLPDSVFKDLGCTLTVASAYPSARDFGLTREDLPLDPLPQTGGRTGGIAVPPAPPPGLEPPRGDVLTGVRNWDSPFGKKFLRGTVIITGTEIASGFVLALLPSQFTKWDDSAYQRGWSNYKRAWTTPPTWDRDSFFNDYLGHPYAGALYYNMMRSQGGTPWQSFGFALFQSTLWEYGIESVAEQPSIQDLVVTPIAGTFVGEVFHQLSLEILRKGHLNLGQKILVFFLNPSWVINNGFRAPE